jgi:hypothetical protein
MWNIIPRIFTDVDDHQRETAMKSMLSPAWRLGTAVALCLGLAACGGSDTEPAAAPAPGDGALAASRPGELTSYVQTRLRTLASQGGLTSGGSMDGALATAVTALPAAGAPAESRSGTLVQEDGVDEPDLIQNDGRFIYTLQPQGGAGPLVAVHERGADGRALARGQVTLAADGGFGTESLGMVLATDSRTLAVVGQHWTGTPGDEICREVCIAIAPRWMRSSVDVHRVDLSDPAAPRAGEHIAIDGHLVDSRRIGDALYVVTSHRPVLAAEQLPATASAAEREAAIARLTAADLLPRLRRNGGPAQPLLSETDCYLQPANASLAVEFTTITVFDLRSPTLAQRSRCFVGGSEALYMSTENLYLATTRWAYLADAGRLVYPQTIQTDIHKFSLSGGVAYRASGQVEGHLGWDRERKSYRLGEYQGDLRVLSYTGDTGWGAVPEAGRAPSPARLTLLRERAGEALLQTVATLPNAARPAPLGKPGEQVFAVRFAGDRGYVVTFRRTDPLYVLDLSDPADPKATGELEVAGFSEMLVPLANGLVLGVGRDADALGRATGLKVALFDVADPAQPSQRASLSLGAAGSMSALDGSRHGLNLMAVGDVVRIALPVNLTASDYQDWRHGLQRLEVDTAARTLRDLGLLGATAGGGYVPMWLERSVQIGDWVYHLRDGRLASHTW